ncbi:MAG TPA: hypothetical protein VEA63_07440 [Opitutus sp.]|nr:hypothetical protein [Opitutus sp.]
MTGEERDALVLELQDRLGEIEVEMYDLEAERIRIEEREAELRPEDERIRARIWELEDTACEYAEDAS